ncbi:glutathione S-transferase [Methylorubrum rhodesianum]|jgi:glutathione S-transferase|uniref:Glutathione S-transferase n=2 Tax=Pseudomonadota TaxID=1224 RepID=A0ABU9ZIG0_9HYPH|nr:MULTISPECIES: glutathione S-transferase [Methylorubrum]MBY0144117.1 glutathione S-transferase [Methylorubrum populi]MRI54908.1 glutathione S-transferase [Methylobacterium sp. DB1607]MBB5764609.1 glutathione S-transferase [Methylorubrum rhodesianum]MBI1688378.1 glutathione S-transferase [Methylorubrum sp. DB1722]MBK3406043.1 glutathione S-transferase [Methylorubrum rhodesianum]
MKLYSLTLSGHAHRARLFLSLVGQPYEAVEVDFAGGQNRSPDFLAINPFGQVPVLDDDGVIVPDSNAILVYLAKKLGRGDWLPEDAEGAARVQRWLSVAAGPIAFGPCAARLVTLFGAAFDAEEVIARAHRILALIDAELSSRDWLAAERPTIADVALYSYIAAAPEGNVDLAAYGHVRAWLARIEALPGFVALPASPVGLNAAGGPA